MADDADKAQERIEVEQAARLAYRRPTGPDAVGYCLFCSTPLQPGMRWCDAECRDAWETWQKGGRK